MPRGKKRTAASRRAVRNVRRGSTSTALQKEIRTLAVDFVLQAEKDNRELLMQRMDFITRLGSWLDEDPKLTGLTDESSTYTLVAALRDYEVQLLNGLLAEKARSVGLSVPVSPANPEQVFPAPVADAPANGSSEGGVTA